MEVPSRQEMFDRAWRGLKSQGWKKAMQKPPGALGEVCTYLTPDGRRCAWGWVDPEGTKDQKGTVINLHIVGIGIAAWLSSEDLHWAYSLQLVHDGAIEHYLDCDMRNFATKHGLTIPDEP